MPVLTKVVRHDPRDPTNASPRVLGWTAFPEAPVNPSVFAMSVDDATELWISLGQQWSVPLADEPASDGKMPGAHLEVHVVLLTEFDQMQKIAQARARFAPPPGAVRLGPNGLPHVNGVG